MKEGKIEITVDGEKRTVPAGMTVDALLDHLGVAKKAAMVGYNSNVLKQKENRHVVVRAGDAIRIVKFLEGG